MSIMNYSLYLRARFALIYHIAGNIGRFSENCRTAKFKNPPMFPAKRYMRANRALSLSE